MTLDHADPTTNSPPTNPPPASSPTDSGGHSSDSPYIYDAPTTTGQGQDFPSVLADVRAQSAGTSTSPGAIQAGIDRRNLEETSPATDGGAGATQPPVVAVTGTGASGTGGTSVTATTSGGVWNSSSDAATLTSLGASPIVTSSEMPQSISDAEQLASGTSVQSLLSSGQSTDAINGAYELLGISNRQISLYAQAAAQGGVGANPPVFGAQSWTQTGSTAFDALKSAAQMRAAISDTGAQDIALLGSGTTVIGTGPGATVASSTSLTSSTPGGLGFSGMYDAVLRGVQSANTYYFPETAAQSMLYGDTGAIKAVSPNQSAFGGHDQASAAAAVSSGRNLLSSSAVASGNVLAFTPSQLGEAAQTLSGLSGQDNAWTPQTVTEAFYAAGELMQGVSSSLAVNPPATGGSAQEDSDARTAAVTAALRQNGITGIDAQTIGQTLLGAFSSPAFTEATGGDQNSANTALSLMSDYDPSDIVPAELADKYGVNLPAGSQTALQSVGRTMLASELSQLGQTALPSPATVPTADEKTAAALTTSAWSVASARWLIDGLQQFGETISPALQGHLDDFKNLVEQCVAGSVEVPVFDENAANPLAVQTFYYAADGQQIASTYAGMQDWAARQSGLTSYLPGGTAASLTEALAQKGQTLAATIDKYGIAALGALGNMGIRAAQLAQASSLGLSQSAQNSLIVYTTADALSLANWATQPNRLGPAVARTFATLEQPGLAAANAIASRLPTDALTNLAPWAGIGIGLPAVPTSPKSTVGQFANWAFTQGTGVGALGLYGGANVYNGIVTITSGQVVKGTLQTILGAADVAKAASILGTSLNPDLGQNWATLNQFAQNANGAVTATRFLAFGVALGEVVLNWPG